MKRRARRPRQNQSLLARPGRPEIIAPKDKKSLDFFFNFVLKFVQVSIRNGLIFNTMKKLFAFALLGMVSWALVGTPVQAKEISKPGISLTKHKHKKHHKKHKKS
jgi:hypothetical protein